MMGDRAACKRRAFERAKLLIPIVLDRDFEEESREFPVAEAGLEANLGWGVTGSFTSLTRWLGRVLGRLWALMGTTISRAWDLVLV